MVLSQLVAADSEDGGGGKREEGGRDATGLVADAGGFKRAAAKIGEMPSARLSGTDDVNGGRMLNKEDGRSAAPTPREPKMPGTASDCSCDAAVEKVPKRGVKWLSCPKLGGEKGRKGGTGSAI